MKPITNYRNRRSGGRRGSALVTSVVVVMLAAAMGAAMLQMQAGMTNRQKLATDQKRALYISEAGLSEGFMALAQGKSGNVGTAALPAAFGDGVFWVTASTQADGKVALISNGLCGSGRFSTAVLVQKQVNTVAALGLFGDQQMTVSPSTVLDGYDSTAGSFSSQAHATSVGTSTGAGAPVAANCDISVQGPGLIGGVLGGVPTTIFGDAHPGPGKSVIATSNTNITGSTAPSPKPLTLPKIDLPPLSSSGNVDLARTLTLTVTGKAVQYDNIRVRSGAKLVLKGPAVVVGKQLNVDSGGTLEFDTTGGSVTVYVTDQVNCATGSTMVNNSGDPKLVAMLIGGGGQNNPSVTLGSSGNFYGMFYAPFSTLSWPSTLRGFGAVSAQKMTFAQTSRFSFDKALLNATSALAGIPTFVSWRIVELPKTTLVESRQDPLTALRAAAITPTKSDDACSEKNITITYVDLSGVVRTYSGRANLFDFLQVLRVIKKVWS